MARGWPPGDPGRPGRAALVRPPTAVGVRGLGRTDRAIPSGCRSAGSCRDCEHGDERSARAARRAGNPTGQTRSPATSAGLCRSATLPWPRIAASPQRLPACGYRRRDERVMDVIDRGPPWSVVAAPSTDLAPHEVGLQPFRDDLNHDLTSKAYAPAGRVSSPFACTGCCPAALRRSHRSSIQAGFTL